MCLHWPVYECYLIEISRVACESFVWQPREETGIAPVRHLVQCRVGSIYCSTIKMSNQLCMYITCAVTEARAIASNCNDHIAATATPTIFLAHLWQLRCLPNMSPCMHKLERKTSCPKLVLEGSCSGFPVLPMAQHVCGSGGQASSLLQQCCCTCYRMHLLHFRVLPKQLFTCPDIFEFAKGANLATCQAHTAQLQ